jgi:hypothetical protein
MLTRTDIYAAQFLRVLLRWLIACAPSTSRPLLRLVCPLDSGRLWATSKR